MSWLDPPAFDDAEASAHVGLQAEYGDTWIHTPTLTKPNFRSQPDKSKPEYELTGVFSWEAQQLKVGMENAGVSSRDPQLTVQKCELRYAVNSGDWFRRKSTGDVFAVTSANPDSLSGVELALVQLGRQT